MDSYKVLSKRNIFIFNFFILIIYLFLLISIFIFQSLYNQHFFLKIHNTLKQMITRKNKLTSPQNRSLLKKELNCLKSLSKHKNKLRLQKSNDQNSVPRNQLVSPNTFRLYTNSNKQQINKNISFKYLINVWCKNQQVIKQLSQLRIKKNLKFIDLPKQPKQPKNMHILSLLEEFTEMYVLYKKKTKDPHCIWYILTKAVNSKSIQQNFNSIYSPIKFKFISSLNTFFNFVNQKRFNFSSQELFNNKNLIESSIFKKLNKVINLDVIQSTYASIEDINSIDFLKFQLLQVNCLYLTNWKFLNEFYKKNQKKNFQNFIIFLDEVSTQQIFQLLNKQKFIFVALQNYENILQRFNFNEFQKEQIKILLQKSSHIKQFVELSVNKIRKLIFKIREFQLQSVIVVFKNLTQQQKQRIKSEKNSKILENRKVYYFFCQQKSDSKLNLGTNFIFQVFLTSNLDSQQVKNYQQIQIEDNCQIIQEALINKIQQKLTKLKIYQNKKNVLKHVALYNIQSSTKNRSFIRQFQNLSKLFCFNTKIQNIYEDLKKTKSKLNVIFGDLTNQRERLFNQFFIINKSSQLKTSLNFHFQLISQIQSAYSRFFMERIGQNQITFVNIFQVQDLDKQLQLREESFKQYKITQFSDCLKEIKQRQARQNQTIFFMIFQMNNFLQDFECQIENLRLNSGAKIQIYLKYGQDFIYRPQNGSYRFIKFSDLKSKINQLVEKQHQQTKLTESFLKIQNYKLNNLNLRLPQKDKYRLPQKDESKLTQKDKSRLPQKDKSDLQVSTNSIDQTNTQYIPQVDLQNFRQQSQIQNKTVKKLTQSKKYQLFICIHRSLPSHSLQNRSVVPYNLLSYYHPQEAFLLIPFLKKQQFLIIIMKAQDNLMVQKYKQKYIQYQNFKVIQLKQLWQNQVKKQIDIQIKLFNLGVYLPSIQKKVKFAPLIIFQQKTQNQLGSKHRALQKVKSLTHVNNFQNQYRMKLNQKSSQKKMKESLFKRKQYSTSKSNKKLITSQKSLGKSINSLHQISFTSINSKLSSQIDENNRYFFDQDEQSQKSSQFQVIDNGIISHGNKYEKTIKILCQKCKSFQKYTNLISFTQFLKLKKTHKLKNSIKLFFFGDQKTFSLIKQFQVQYLSSVKKLLLTYLNPVYQTHQEEIMEIKFCPLSIFGQMIRSKQKLNKISNSESLKNIKKQDQWKKFHKTKKKIKNIVLCSNNCPVSIKEKSNFLFQQKEDLINLLFESSLSFNFTIVILTTDQFSEFQEQIQWKSNNKCLPNIFFLILSQNNGLSGFYQTNKYYTSKQKAFQHLSNVIKTVQQKQLYETFSIQERQNDKVNQDKKEYKNKQKTLSNNTKKSNIISSSKKYIYEQIYKPTHLNIQILSKEELLDDESFDHTQDQQILQVLFIKKQELSIFNFHQNIKAKRQIVKIFSETMLERLKNQAKTILKIHEDKKQQNIRTSTFLQYQNQKILDNQNVQQIILICLNEDFQYVSQFVSMHPNMYLITLRSLADLLSFRSIFPWLLVIPGQWSFLKAQNGIMIDYSTQKFERKLNIYINNFRNRLKKNEKKLAQI